MINIGMSCRPQPPEIIPHMQLIKGDGLVNIGFESVPMSGCSKRILQPLVRDVKGNDPDGSKIIGFANRIGIEGQNNAVICAGCLKTSDSLIHTDFPGQPCSGIPGRHITGKDEMTTDTRIRSVPYRAEYPGKDRY